MYYMKVYNYFNNEVTSMQEKSERFSDLDTKAILLSKRLSNKKIYVIIEDDNYERFGWYENGVNLDRNK